MLHAIKREKLQRDYLFVGEPCAAAFKIDFFLTPDNQSHEGHVGNEKASPDERFCRSAVQSREKSAFKKQKRVTKERRQELLLSIPTDTNDQPI